MDEILWIKTKRVLRNDLTILHKGKSYQIQDKVGAKEVTVEQRIDGSMLVTYKGISLKYKEITTRPKREQKAPEISTPKRVYIPPKDHRRGSSDCLAHLILRKKKKKRSVG